MCVLEKGSAEGTTAQSKLPFRGFNLGRRLQARKTIVDQNLEVYSLHISRSRRKRVEAEARNERTKTMSAEKRTV